MIRYTVVWQKQTEADLANIWNEGVDRNAIAEAANRIDSELAVDAHMKGTLVSERSRELCVDPLHIMFRVDQMDRRVDVYRISRV